MSTLRIGFEQLLHHEQFVRQTLHGLLRDPAQIDDAVQETWLRAWQRAPSDLTEPKTWLARTARNLAIGNWRSERRRAAREQAVATAAADTGESAAASQRRVEMCQKVVAAILALDEPYRSVVLLRYEQGLDFAAIGQRLGRSPATVRSQLSRAHDQLRERLDREFGSRERWAGMAATFVGAPVPTLGLVTGLVFVGAASALTLTAYMLWNTLADVPAPPAAPAVAAAIAGASSDAAAAAAPPNEVRRVPVELPQDPQPKSALRTSATLYDRGYYEDYELATFSLEHGLRDDPGLRITRNDWDLLFSRGKFSVRLGSDDQSLIGDLGPLNPTAFGATELPTLLRIDSVDVRAGHAYFIGTHDTDTRLATVLFVREYEPGRTCHFDWFTTDGTGRWQGSIADPGSGRPWLDELTELRRRQLAAQNQKALRQPLARLQLRGGAGGGNARRVDLTGMTNAYVHARHDQPIDVGTPATIDERCLAYSEGGTVPAGSAFVITRIDYRGGNRGDTNGRGGFRILVNDQAVVDLPQSSAPIAGTWTGRLVVQGGDEGRTFFEICNSSWGEVLLHGTFEAGTALPGFGGANEGFGRPPALAKKEVRTIGVPEVRLQLRTDEVGGNGCRLDLRTLQTMRIDRLANKPLDFTAPMTANERCVGFGSGGMLPQGCTFIVTGVRYRTKTGNAQASPLRIVVAGVEIVNTATADTEANGEQHGEFEIPAGEETRTYVELGNGSYADVVLTGRFEY